MAEDRKLFTRRDFLKTAGVTAVGAAAVACGADATATPRPAAATAMPEPTAGAGAEIVGGPLEVGVFQEEGAWFDLTKKLGDQFEKDFPGTKITYTFANTASDAERALRWEAGNPLDLDTGKWNNQASATWDWVDNGFVLDITEYLEEPLPSGEKWMDIYAPITHSFAVDQRPDSPTNGSWFGVPQTIVLMLMQYNQKAFDEMGVEPATNWEDFLDLCATINEKGADKGMKPICVSGPTAFYTGHYWDRMVQRVVGRPEVEKVLHGDAHLRDNPGFLRAAQEIEKIIQNDWLMEGYEGADFTAAQPLYFQGKAAMIHMGTWLTAEMADSIPEGFVVGSFDFPKVPDGKGNQDSMFGTSHIFSIPNPEKSTSHEVNVPLALEFLRRFTGREHTAERAQVVGNISPCTGVAPPPKQPGIDKLVADAAKGELIVYYYGNHWDSALTEAWYPPVQAMFLKKATAEQVIEQIDEGMDKYRALKES